MSASEQKWRFGSDFEGIFVAVSWENVGPLRFFGRKDDGAGDLVFAVPVERGASVALPCAVSEVCGTACRESGEMLRAGDRGSGSAEADQSVWA